MDPRGGQNFFRSLFLPPSLSPPLEEAFYFYDGRKKRRKKKVCEEAVSLPKISFSTETLLLRLFFSAPLQCLSSSPFFLAPPLKATKVNSLL